MDITMDYFEGLEELFDQDITADYLAESFNTGPIKFENIFDDNQVDQFDSLVAEDISSFLDSEIQAGYDGVACKEELYLENVLDGNNNTDKIDKIDCLFNLDDLDLEIGDACQLKEELKEFPDEESAVNSPLDFLNVPSSSNKGLFPESSHLFTIEQAKTVKQEKNIQDDKDRNKEMLGQNHNEVKNVNYIKVEVLDKNVKKKYPIVPYMKVDDGCLKPKKGNQSPARRAVTKDMKAFQFCDLCPFKTKEKSIFRMHQSLVHKLDMTKCPKKTPKKSETLEKSYQPATHKKRKIYEGIQRETLNKKALTTTANGLDKKLKFTKPSLESYLFPKCPITHNGNYVNQNEKTQLNSPVFNLAPVKAKEVDFSQANTSKVSYCAFPLSTNRVAAVKTNQVSSDGYPRTINTLHPANNGFPRNVDPLPSANISPVSFNAFPTSAGYIRSIGRPSGKCMPSIVPAKSNCVPNSIPPGDMPSVVRLAKVETTTNMPSIVKLSRGEKTSSIPSIVKLSRGEKTSSIPSIVKHSRGENTSSMPSILKLSRGENASSMPSILKLSRGENTSRMPSIVKFSRGEKTTIMPSNVRLPKVETTTSNFLPTIVRLPTVETTTSSQFPSANPSIVRVASCKIISSAPRKFVSILPKGPNCLINRFIQPNGKNRHQSNGRLLRNHQERQRRNETKQALDTVKDLVPRLQFAEKPSQIKVLKETIEYVKYLQNVEQDDSEELEAHRKIFAKLNSKYRSFFSRS